MEDQALRLKTLWRSGREKFLSFYKVLNEVREEIGDVALADYCFDELQLGLTTIFNVRKVLNEADQDMVRSDLDPAAKLEKERRRLARQQVKHDRQIAKAKAEAALAQHRADKVKAEDEADKTAHKQHKRSKARDNPNDRGPRRGAIRDRNEILADQETPLDDIALMLRKAIALRDKGLADWVEGSIALAVGLHTARERFSDNGDFGAWLEASGVTLEKNDRAALINLGRLEIKRLQEIFYQSDSRSYRALWDEHKPKLQIVEKPQ